MDSFNVGMAAVSLQTGDVMEQGIVQMTLMKLVVHIPPVKRASFSVTVMENASLSHGYVTMKRTVKMVLMNINNALGEHVPVSSLHVQMDSVSQLDTSVTE